MSELNIDNFTYSRDDLNEEGKAAWDINFVMWGGGLPTNDWLTYLAMPLCPADDLLNFINSTDHPSRPLLAKMLRMDTLAGYINHVKDGGTFLYKPTDFINWCIHKQFYVPKAILDSMRNRNEIKEIVRDAINDCFDIKHLELLTDEQKQDYNNRAAWSWVDAIYILQGFKPVSQLSTEQVRSHFPDLVSYFTESIQLGKIGKEVNRAGEKSFIDSPANWQTFWQTFNQAINNTVEVAALMQLLITTTCLKTTVIKPVI